MGCTNHSEHQIRLFFPVLKILPQIHHQKGDGIDHAIDHQQPMQPRKRDYAQQEHQDKAAKRITVDADQLYQCICTSGSFSVSHFRNFKIK